MSTFRIAQRVGQLSKSAIHEMTRLSKEIEDVAFLSWAKPTVDTPEHIKQAAIEAIKQGWVGGYSETAGLLPLRQAIVKKLHRDNQIEAQANEVLVTVGAIEGLAAAIMALIDPGDEVLLPSPTYSTHIRQVLLASGRPVMVPTIEEQGFCWDFDALEQAVTAQTKAILYCSPSNPTGTVFSRQELEKLGAFAQAHNLMVITDEAYEYFVYDDNTHCSIAALPGMRERVVSCFTFTKTYAMTGWRVGYLHAAEPVMAQIMKAHIPFAICAPVVSQYAALAALEGPQDCVDNFRQHYCAARDLMCSRLARLEHVFSYQTPGGSYLMFPKILVDSGRTDSRSFCIQMLKQAKVSTTPGVAFGPTGEGHLRLSFCVPPAMINKAFDRLEAYFASSSTTG